MITPIFISQTEKQLKEKGEDVIKLILKPVILNFPQNTVQ